MTLRLRRRSEITNTEAYLVLCGRAHVGAISRVPHGPTAGCYTWSITGWWVEPQALGTANGRGATLEEAMAQFAERYRAWLAWAGLKEIEAGEELTE